MRIIAIIVLSAALSLSATAQVDGDGGREWEQLLSDIAAFDGEDEEQWQRAYDQLAELDGHPININTATREQLEQLLFLTDAQVEDIEEYIYLHGPMGSLAELMMIESIDYSRRRLLECFTYAGQPAEERPTFGELLRRGKGELTATARVPLYDRRGDRNGYLGYKYKHWMRFTFDAGERLKVGFTASQDAGEPFFGNKNTMGYDFYSFYIRLGCLGPVEKLVLGRYTVAFGMGLVANTGFALGKQTALASLGRAQAGIRPSASRSTDGYLQGAAATVAIGRKAKVSAFASYRPHDATLNDDGTARTLVTTGYHRTPTEMAKKNNTHSATAGLNVSVNHNGLHAGLTATYTHFDRELRPNTSTLYRRFYASGNDFTNVSADYAYVSHFLTLRGETAINRDGHVATLNSISINAADNVSIVALHRFYSFQYTAILANSFSESGRVQNENGAYLGIDWRPLSQLRIAAYTDYAHFAWLRYQASLPSWASDNMVEASYSATRFTLEGRYRLRIRQKDNDNKTALENHYTHRARLALSYGRDGAWDGRTQADVTVATHKATDCGYMLSQRVGLKMKWMRFDAFVAYFHTDSYDSRLYAYERGTLNSFSNAAYYGHGVRCSLMARADIGRWLTLIAKVGVTNYFDRSTISSGLQEVDGSSMTDIDVQARWRF